MIEVRGYLTPARVIENGKLTINNLGSGAFLERFESDGKLTAWLEAEITAGRQIILVSLRHI